MRPITSFADCIAMLNTTEDVVRGTHADFIKKSFDRDKIDTLKDVAHDVRKIIEYTVEQYNTYQAVCRTGGNANCEPVLKQCMTLIGDKMLLNYEQSILDYHGIVMYIKVEEEDGFYNSLILKTQALRKIFIELASHAMGILKRTG